MEPDKKRAIPKRQFPRRRFAKTIGLLFRGQYTLTNSVQIGEGGMMVQSPFGLGEGNKLIVSFMVPGRMFMIVTAQVQYIIEQGSDSNPSYGLKFLTISFESRRHLRDFIAAKTEAEANEEGIHNYSKWES